MTLSRVPPSLTSGTKGPLVERTWDTLTFSSGGRTIEARLSAEGGVLETEVAERFGDDDAAAAALGRARKALLDDGWREG